MIPGFSGNLQPGGALPSGQPGRYNKKMRHVLLALFVWFAAQPVPAALISPCDGMDGSHATHMTMQAGDHQTMDCCDHHQTGGHDGCNPQSHCGGCVVAAVVIDNKVLPAPFAAPVQPGFGDAPTTLAGAYSPPFRPPIG